MIKQSKHNWRPHSCKDWENETYQFKKDDSNISLNTLPIQKPAPSSWKDNDIGTDIT